ncbi:hypothetical protein DWB77_00957 [Streptomyces hundungensis]|uniref:Uncharacterized protein n=1 Tax=Streptomyces hundungensis TaxID=1077946 RepID=A0A387HDT9_9ACTN|nr:hypothetical protein [Streptomyces hundungensis]AYG78848.1 hypothetical protein DWB77_00957 [Streptomyces hundungensis]
MTAETERSGDESADVHEARLAIDAYMRRTSARTQQEGAAGPLADQGAEAGGGERPGQDDDRVDDRVAECVAREAWDAVQDATPPPPDPEAGPSEKTTQSPERAELHRRAVAIARGLQALGYHLDETLLPGPDMAAG